MHITPRQLQAVGSQAVRFYFLLCDLALLLIIITQLLSVSNASRQNSVARRKGFTMSVNAQDILPEKIKKQLGHVLFYDPGKGIGFIKPESDEPGRLLVSADAVSVRFT